MNERIKELAEQAGCGYLYDYSADGHAMVCNVNDIEKFAELLVKECAMLVEGFILDQEVALDEYVEYEASSVLREHFEINSESKST
jgi:hypothetical protein